MASPSNREQLEANLKVQIPPVSHHLSLYPLRFRELLSVSDYSSVVIHFYSFSPSPYAFSLNWDGLTSPFDGPASYKVKDSPHFVPCIIRDLRKPAWMVYVLLNCPGENAVAVNGGDDLFGALATYQDDQGKSLVYASGSYTTPPLRRSRCAWPFSKPTYPPPGPDHRFVLDQYAPAGPLRRRPHEQPPTGSVATFRVDCPGGTIIER